MTIKDNKPIKIVATKNLLITKSESMIQDIINAINVIANKNKPHIKFAVQTQPNERRVLFWNITPIQLKWMHAELIAELKCGSEWIDFYEL